MRAEPSTRSNRAKLLLKAAFSALLLGVICYRVEWAQVGAILRRIEWRWFELTLLLNALGVTVSVLKWQGFLSVHGIRRSLLRLHSLYILGFFINNFLPSMVGGDAFRVMRTGNGGRHAEALCAVLGERLTGLIAMLLMAAAAAAWNLTRHSAIGLNWVLALMVVMPAGMLAGWWLLGALAAKAEGGGTRWARLGFLLKLRAALLSYLDHPGVLVRAFALSAVFHVLLISNGWLYARSLGLHLDFMALAVIFPVAMLVAMAPVSFNGLGLLEGSLILLLGQLGVTREEALIIAALSRLFIIIASGVGAIVFVIDRPEGAVAAPPALHASQGAPAISAGEAKLTAS